MHVSPWTSLQTIPSDTAIGSELVHSLLAEMLERDWPSVELFHVQLAYEEAIVNAIVHGNRGAADKTVEVQMTCDRDSVWIQITDQGAGFDPAAVPDPTQGELLGGAGRSRRIADHRGDERSDIQRARQPDHTQEDPQYPDHRNRGLKRLGVPSGQNRRPWHSNAPCDATTPEVNFDAFRATAPKSPVAQLVEQAAVNRLVSRFESCRGS